MRIRRAFALVVLTAVVPGTAQLVAGHRRLGQVLLRAWLGVVGLVLLGGLAFLADRELVLGLVTSPVLLITAALILHVLALAWPAAVADAWRLGRPRNLPARIRRWLAAVAALLMLVTGYPMLALGQRAWAAADLIRGVFAGTRTSSAVGGRFNVLLLGGDAGPDRLGVRPDSLTLASIDATTGQTVLFSLPRNLENVPFPAGSTAARALPNGWSCGDACLLNAIYTWGAQNASLFPGALDPGAEATKQAVQGVTGLTVNYYVLIDLAGFEQLINAMGGIDLTVGAKVPIGGETSKISGWIQPGRQHLDGYHALWFARSRATTSDYDRMARQRCVMSAMLHQLNPVTVLDRFNAIAAAGKHVVSTDIPAGQLSRFLTLAQQARSQKVTSVQFVPPLITPARPDYGQLRRLVRDALDGHPASRPAATSAAGVGTSPPAGGTASGGTAPSGTTPATTGSAGAGNGSTGSATGSTGGATGSTGGATGSTGGATGSTGGAPVDLHAVCAA